jgi:hypothetical protein
MANLMIQHILATIAYRCSKAIEHAPKAFAQFEMSEGIRKPIKILSHIADLFQYTSRKVIEQREIVKEDRTIDDWEYEVERFYQSLEQFDTLLLEQSPLEETILLKLVQGPLADALTHVGQLAMIRRAMGAPIASDNYFKAEVQAGKYRY